MVACNGNRRVRLPVHSARIASVTMQDLLMLFFTAVFFAIAFLYVKACQKLR
jgi:hypothetical protein